MERNDFVAGIILIAITVGSLITVWTLRNMAENHLRDVPRPTAEQTATARPSHYGQPVAAYPQRSAQNAPARSDANRNLPFFTKPKTTINHELANAGIPQHYADKQPAAPAAATSVTPVAQPGQVTTQPTQAAEAEADPAALQQMFAYLAEVERSYGPQTAEKLHQLMEDVRAGKITPKQFSEQSQTLLQNRRAEMLAEQRKEVHQRAQDYLHQVETSDPFEQLTPQQQQNWRAQATGYLQEMEQQVSALMERTDLTPEQVQQQISQVQADTNAKLQAIKL